MTAADKLVADLVSSLSEEAKAGFVDAMKDGVLEFSEIVGISVRLASKLRAAGEGLGGAQKKELLMLALETGLKAAGRPAEEVATHLKIGSAAVDVAFDVAAGRVNLGGMKALAVAAAPSVLGCLAPCLRSAAAKAPAAVKAAALVPALAGVDAALAAARAAVAEPAEAAPLVPVAAPPVPVAAPPVPVAAPAPAEPAPSPPTQESRPASPPVQPDTPPEHKPSTEPSAEPSEPESE